MIVLMIALAISMQPPNVLGAATPAETRFLQCVSAHESRHDPQAQNPKSSASGKYQMIDSTWRGVAKWAKWDDFYPGRAYRKARLAPEWVQDLAALHIIRHGGFHAWHGTGCRYNGHEA